uniref:Endolysin n=1 Tax=Salmonella phage vB_STmST313_KE27 TaxID=3161178 RepID=A0AAU8GJ76_9CAUD
MAILKLGNRGSEVKSLQQSLNKIGFSLTADGIFGKATENAVKSVQAGAGLDIDGIAGPKTFYAIRNAGDAHQEHLTEADLVDAARELGVELASMKAVNQVESRGTGFTKTGKIKTLFERHIMYKKVTAKFGQARANALYQLYPTLVNPNSGGYIGGDAELERLQGAIALDEDCAYESASYGLFQIMGFNCQICGYSNAKEMFTDFLTGERAHLLAFVKFIKADANMWKALKNKNWAEFARRYNGPAYAKNQYDTKLAAAYKSFC